MATDQGWSSVPNWVIRSDKLHGSEKLLYIALLNRANAKGECWPSLATLEKEVGVSNRTVIRLISSLCEKGLVEKVKRSKPGVGKVSNLYKVLAFKAEPPSDTLALATANEHRSDGAIWQVASDIQHHEVLPSEVLPNRSTTHIQFERVWESWPKKTEKDRAEKEYLKHVKSVPGLAGRIAEFGDAYQRTTAKRYIPSLAAWLHRKRWSDELPQNDDGQGPSRADVAHDFIASLEGIDAAHGGGAVVGDHLELR